jgi:hypothetical protein
MIHRALEFLQHRISEKWINGLGAFFSSLTFLGLMDVVWRCITGGITLLFAYLAWNRHKATMEVKNLEKEKLQQEIGDIIQSNKNKHKA